VTPPPINARFLMCPPDHFGVTYAINPWMDPSSWARNDHVLSAASHREWTALRQRLTQLGATVELVPAAAGLPDLVFTANAAVVLDRKALLARFRHPERQPEQDQFELAFRTLQRRGLIDEVIKLPESLMLEGAGDCVWDQARGLFWMGCGPRSDAAARDVIEEVFETETIALELVDPRFYHMDTAFSPLPRGEVMFVPEAFTPEGRARIRERVAPAQLIEVGIDDACRLAANTVCLGNELVMSDCGERLRSSLTERGYRVVTTPLHSFLRSGGAAFCLTLRLDRHSDRLHMAAEDATAA
jgi:N-dimethylarginine dimethylaminohydrolase